MDPRHNKSGMNGERKTNMTELEKELEDVVKEMDEAEDDVTSTAKAVLDKEKDRLAASALGLKKRKSLASAADSGLPCSSGSIVSECKPKVAVMQNGEDDFFSRMAGENEERMKMQKFESEVENGRKDNEQKFQQGLEDRKSLEQIRQNERSYVLAIEQMKVAQEQVKFRSQMMVLMQVAIDRDRDLNNRDSKS